MRNPKASPPALQPKQWKMPRLGLTVKDGVFSAWKGQSPFQCWPARLRFTNWPTSSTMSRRERISSRSWGLNPAILCARRRNGLPRAMRRVQLQGGARWAHARRTLCTFHSEGGFAPLPKPPPQDSLRRQSRRSKAEHFHVGTRATDEDSHGPALKFRFERGLRPRNRVLGEASEGASAAPSDETKQ